MPNVTRNMALYQGVAMTWEQVKSLHIRRFGGIGSNIGQPIDKTKYQQFVAMVEAL